MHPDAAKQQSQAETPTQGPGGGGANPSDGSTSGVTGLDRNEDGGKTNTRQPHRFHGSVNLDPARVGRDAGRIADEVLPHLSGLVGSFCHGEPRNRGDRPG